MKRILLICSFLISVSSCSAANDRYKQTIVDYLQTENGVKTDLKIEFREFVVSDITVADSVRILQERFMTEQQAQIESAQQGVDYWLGVIAGHEAKEDNLTSQALARRAQNDLQRAEETLRSARQWSPDYLGRYHGRDNNEVLAKRIESTFTFQNPKLTVRQEISAVFILSMDGTECYRMIKK